MGKRDTKKKGSSSSKDDRDVVTDTRFRRMHQDPRFEKISEKQTKVVIDKRFSKVFTDDRFTSTKAKVDKYGRPFTKDQKSSDLRRYYRQEDKDKKGSGSSSSSSDSSSRSSKSIHSYSSSASGSRSSSSSSTGLPSDYELVDGRPVFVGASKKGRLNRALEPEEEKKAGFGKYEAEAEEDVEDIEEETYRIAVLNLDWSRVKAVDIFALLNSFVPSGGVLKHVTIYPSDFGLQEQEKEDRLGPQGIWEDKGQAGEEGTGHDDDDGSSGSVDDDDGSRSGVDGDGDGFDKERLRQYELKKLRYYFAIAEFDSPRSALAVYSSCDGQEFEATANVMDLRFVPDDLDYSTRQIKEKTTSIPPNYEPPTFTTQALQHTNVRLTWDETPVERRAVLNRAPTQEDIEQSDFKAFLASGSEGSDTASSTDSEQQEYISGPRTQKKKADKKKDKKEKKKTSRKAEKLRKKYAALLKGDDDIGEKREGDLEITFQAGLGEVGAQILEQRAEKQKLAEETVWETYQRKKREKKVAIKKARKDAIAKGEDPRAAVQALREKWAAQGDKKGETAGTGLESDDSASMDSETRREMANDPFFAQDFGDGIDNPLKSSSSKSKSGKKGNDEAKKREREEERKKKEREQAELDLLMMDEGEDGKASQGYHLERMLENAKQQGKKKGKKKKGKHGSGVEPETDGFSVDVNDPRFSAVFKSKAYAIDPTATEFKKTEGMQAIIAERQRRLRKRDRETGAQQAPQEVDRKASSNTTRIGGDGGDGVDVNKMVERLKKKAKKKKL